MYDDFEDELGVLKDEELYGLDDYDDDDELGSFEGGEGTYPVNVRKTRRFKEYQRESGGTITDEELRALIVDPYFQATFPLYYNLTDNQGNKFNEKFYIDKRQQSMIGREIISELDGLVYDMITIGEAKRAKRDTKKAKGREKKTGTKESRRKTKKEAKRAKAQGKSAKDAKGRVKKAAEKRGISPRAMAEKIAKARGMSLRELIEEFKAKKDATAVGTKDTD